MAVPMQDKTRLSRVRVVALLTLAVLSIWAVGVSTSYAASAAQDQYLDAVPTGDGNTPTSGFTPTLGTDTPPPVTPEAVEKAADKAHEELASSDEDAPGVTEGENPETPAVAAVQPKSDDIGSQLKSTFTSTTGRVVMTGALVAAGGILLSLSAGGAAVAGGAAAVGGAAAAAGGAAAAASGAAAAGGVAAAGTGAAAGGTAAGGAAGSGAAGAGQSAGATFLPSG